MKNKGNRTYVGFGFGAIQSGLFLNEAYRSGNFSRLVVAEVMPDVVEEVKRSSGDVSINVAHSDHVEKIKMGIDKMLEKAKLLVIVIVPSK